MRTYVDTLSKLPKKISPNDPRPIAELIASTGSKMSATTRAAHARAVNMFVGWCRDQQYRIAPNLGRILAPVLKKRKSSKLRKLFTDAELRSLFESEAYKKGAFTRDADYWLPILGVFTGARQAELCQLLSSDIRQDPETSIWYIDINDNGDKRLKNESSRRHVPLHPEIERLNFIRFAQRAADNPGGKLFPDEKRNARGEFGAFSKRFNRYKERQGIENTSSTKLDFHSLRHTVISNLLGQGCEEHVVNDIVGHSQASRSESAQTYKEGARLEAKHDVLLKLCYGFKLQPITQSKAST
jgi:integrase